MGEEGIRCYGDLRVWQMGMNLAVRCYEVSGFFLGGGLVMIADEAK